MIDLEITDLGAGGDGIARDADGHLVFIPYGLPGDHVRVQVKPGKDGKFWGKIVDILTPSPERIAPPCAHFFDCGGCALQHFSVEAYRRWKFHTVIDRLEKAGIKPKTVHPLVSIDPLSRRRATFAARRVKGKIILGFNRHHSDEIIDLRECHVVIPEIVAVLPAVRVLMETLLDPVKEADISLTRLDTGLDVLITAEVDLNLLMREAMAEFVQGADVARLSLRTHERAAPEIILQPRPARVRFGATDMEIPPGTFLQPSRAGEAALVAAVLNGVGPAKTIADLFSGSGAFTFPLSVHASVHAVDADGPAIRSLMGAGARNVSAQARNLYKDPLSASELKKFDAVVFDPPRAGAKAQIAPLVQSGVPVIVAVSCNPASFVTDCKPFVEAGYSLKTLTVVDQFVWSAHVEIVGVFQK